MVMEATFLVNVHVWHPFWWNLPIKNMFEIISFLFLICPHAALQQLLFSTAFRKPCNKFAALLFVKPWTKARVQQLLTMAALDFRQMNPVDAAEARFAEMLDEVGQRAGKLVARTQKHVGRWRRELRAGKMRDKESVITRSQNYWSPSAWRWKRIAQTEVARHGTVERNAPRLSYDVPFIFARKAKDHATFFFFESKITVIRTMGNGTS